jgi:type II secretory pathway component PulM
VTKLASTEGNEIADRTSYNKLLQWEQTLPDKFRKSPAQISLERGFWPALVQVLYW